MSGSRTAKGSSPTISRAHHTAWPSPSGACWRVKLVWPGLGQVAREGLELLDLAALLQGSVELVGDVEMVLDDGLAAAGDEHEVLDAGGPRVIDHVLHDRAVDDRSTSPSARPWWPEGTGAEASDGKDGFADALHRGAMCGERAFGRRRAGFATTAQ
jgi:hypothetical protein